MLEYFDLTLTIHFLFEFSRISIFLLNFLLLVLFKLGMIIGKTGFLPTFTINDDRYRSKKY